MHRRLGISIVVVLLSACLSSPALADPGFTLKGGVAWSGLRGERGEHLRLDLQTERRTGLILGVGIELPLLGMLSVQPEVLYVQRGETLRPSPVLLPQQTFTLTEQRILVSSLDVPLLLRLRPWTGAALAPSFYAGPTLSMELEATYEVHVGDLVMDFDADEEFENLDVGLTVGAGLDFGPRNALSLEARYVHGLRDVDTTGERQRWATGMLMAGFRF